jgi:hypothetical protein
LWWGWNFGGFRDWWLVKGKSKGKGKGKGKGKSKSKSKSKSKGKNNGNGPNAGISPRSVRKKRERSGRDDSAVLTGKALLYVLYVLCALCSICSMFYVREGDVVEGKVGAIGVGFS